MSSNLPTILPYPSQYLQGQSLAAVSPYTPQYLQGPKVLAGIPESLSTIGAVLSIAGAATGMYHGYLRNDQSVGWGIAWTIFGSLLPVFSIPLSLAQGFGKPKNKNLNGLAGLFSNAYRTRRPFRRSTLNLGRSLHRSRPRRRFR